MPSRASAAATAAAAASSAAAAAKPREGVAGAERAEVSAMSRRASGKPSGSRHWSSASASHGSLVAAALAGECARVCAVWSSLAPPSRSENEGDASPAPRSRSSLLWMARCASRTRAGSPLFVARSQRRVSRSFGTSGKYSRVMMASRRATYSSSSSTTGPARRGARGAGGASAAHPRRDGTRPRADPRRPPRRFPPPRTCRETLARDAVARDAVARARVWPFSVGRSIPRRFQRRRLSRRFGARDSWKARGTTWICIGATNETSREIARNATTSQSRKSSARTRRRLLF